MNDVEPRGAVHWIDHFVVGTNDMPAWVDWAVQQGADWDTASRATKEELQRDYGGRL